ncbi:D-glucuronyl C5-epimerase family protein [Shewanella algae]|uniref:D-glucuronyl C5-epimerase family protein n=1 Tax=Shewanella algae TaxID=38313 RepID=UPI003006B444
MRKLTLNIFLVLLCVYLITLCYRAYNLNIYERYKLSNTLEIQSNFLRGFTYPVYWNDSHVDSILESVDEDNVFLIDYDKTKNLAPKIGQQYYPISIAISSLRVIQALDYNEPNLESTKLVNFIRSNLNWLVDNQADNGLWYANFEHKFGGQELGDSWPSGLAQGAGISALLRGYILFKDQRYLDAAKKAYHAMFIPIDKGGVLSISAIGQVIEEYPTSNPTHVLNGYLYSIISLVDMKRFLHADEKEYLTSQITYLNSIIKRYDLYGGWSAYSLDEPTLRNHYTYANPLYHKLHIVQLSFLCENFNKKNICDVANNFKDYESGIGFWTVTFAYFIFVDLVTIYKLI